jgi:hypothetical protein
MINHSQAYAKLREEIQASMDFVLLCCHAIPALSGYIKAVDKGSVPKLPDPHYFRLPTDQQRLKEIMPEYRKVLGRFLLLTSFSYFEAYIGNIFDEIFDFHKDSGGLLQIALKKRENSLKVIDPKIEHIVRKLRERPQKSKMLKYQKLSKSLDRTGFRFPSDLFSFYGIIVLQERIKDLRSVQIPDLIKTALGIDITEKEKENYHRIRELRNGIAHGKVKEVDLIEGIQDMKFLRSLAQKIDRHVSKHFFIIEND